MCDRIPSTSKWPLLYLCAVPFAVQYHSHRTLLECPPKVKWRYWQEIYQTCQMSPPYQYFQQTLSTGKFLHFLAKLADTVLAFIREKENTLGKLRLSCLPKYIFSFFYHSTYDIFIMLLVLIQHSTSKFCAFSSVTPYASSWEHRREKHKPTSGCSPLGNKIES